MVNWGGGTVSSWRRAQVMNTKSEDLFEAFLTANGVAFSRIEEAQGQKGAHRPDYLIELGNGQLIFELKQLGDDEAVERAQLVGGWSSTPGDALRQFITRSKKQIQYGASQGIPSILLVYNNTDPVFQTRGTDAFDFQTAMYGELTMLIDKQPQASFFMVERVDFRKTKTHRLVP